jgi:hypothetical protein
MTFESLMKTVCLVAIIVLTVAATVATGKYYKTCTQLTINQCDVYLEQCERAFYGSPKLEQCIRSWKECRQTGVWR